MQQFDVLVSLETLYVIQADLLADQEMAGDLAYARET